MPDIIHTSRLSLRPYTEADCSAFCRFMIDPELARYMDNNPADQAQAAAMFEKVQAIYANPPQGRYFDIWAIEFEGACIGHLELKQSENTQPGELEVVYLIEKPYWNRGLMSELLSALVTYVGKMGSVIIATIDQNNQASWRVLEKLGVSKTAQQPGSLKVWLAMRGDGIQDGDFSSDPSAA